MIPRNSLLDIFVPIHYITDEYEFSTFFLMFLFTTFLIMSIILLIWYGTRDYVKKLHRNCSPTKSQDKCSYNKKCILTETALGNDINSIIEKCFK